MKIYSFEESSPLVSETAFVAPSASLIGRIKIGNFSSIWFNSVLRGDVEQIHIGEETNFQDLSVGHADPGFPLIIGDRVTIGHRCITHGCEIEDDCVIGMGAILKNGGNIDKKIGPIVKLNKIEGLLVFLNVIKLVKYLKIYFE